MEASLGGCAFAHYLSQEQRHCLKLILKTVAPFGVYICHTTIIVICLTRVSFLENAALDTRRERCVVLMTRKLFVTWMYRTRCVKGHARQTTIIAVGPDTPQKARTFLSA